LRLSDEVLAYTNDSLQTNALPTQNIVTAIDNVLHPHLISHLQHVFRPSSPFWKEHDYDKFNSNSRQVGYFSYLYPFKNRAACCSIEVIIDKLLPIIAGIFPQISTECQHAEWWVHSRPHTSGHQLHFDSDETGISEGMKATHPIASCVIYLNEDCGGPTLVTDQILGHKLATRGWLCFPKVNRLVAFDARYLHGVVPGRPSAPHDPLASRLSFMVGFWRNICAKPRGIDQPGPGQPFPVPESTYTWPQEMELNLLLTEDTLHKPFLNPASALPVHQPAPITQVSTVWVPLSSEFITDEAPHYLNCFQGF
jgi:hypothetical protein